MFSHSKQDVLQLDVLEVRTLPVVASFSDMTMANVAIKDLVQQCQSKGGNKGQRGLTRRLLKRVRSTAEREFVGGRFLTPVALRYDNQDVSRYTVDKTCIFFSFPYFRVAKSGLRKHFEKGDQRHPPRTLLQSHYRLNRTVDRDEDQCITLLKDGNLASLTNESEKARRSWPSRTIDYLVFVPQFWGVIDGLGVYFWAGTSEKYLLGKIRWSLVGQSTRLLLEARA